MDNNTERIEQIETRMDKALKIGQFTISFIGLIVIVICAFIFQAKTDTMQDMRLKKLEDTRQEDKAEYTSFKSEVREDIKEVKKQTTEILLIVKDKQDRPK